MPHSDQDVTARALARIEAAKGRADAATPGPWVRDGLDILEPWSAEDEQGYVCHIDPDSWLESATTDFIAHARADVPLLAAIATAAVRLIMRDGNADYPWWYLSDECVGCLRGSSGLAEWGDFIHGPNCPAAVLDAAIRAAGEAR